MRHGGLCLRGCMAEPLRWLWTRRETLRLGTALALSAVACGGGSDDHDSSPVGCNASCGGTSGASGSANAGEGHGGSGGATEEVDKLVLTVDEQGTILKAEGLTVNEGLEAGATVAGATIVVELSDVTRATSLWIEDRSGKAVVLTGLPAIPLSAEVAGSLTIGASGDVLVERILASQGSVTIEAKGSVRDLAPNADSEQTTPSILSATLTIDAASGIGAAGNALEFDSDCSTLAAVRLKAGDAIFATETGGDLCVDAIVSLTSDVAITARDGSILDAIGDEEADIQGARVDIVAHGGGVGSSDHALDIYGAGTGQSNNQLEIEPSIPEDGRLLVVADNEVYVREINGALHVLEATSTAGAVTLSNFDTAFSGESLELLAGGESLLGDKVSGEISGPLAVKVTDFDSVLIEEGAVVSSGTEIRIGRDQSSDLLGSNLDIRGDVDAPEVSLVGGPNLDYIQVNTATGINAGGQTILSGGDGDDRFFVRASSGPLLLRGEGGADRYYLAANANRSLFTGSGFYQDDYPVVPLDLLSGSLGRFGSVEIDAGNGGNGGTRDVIYVSADQSTGALAGALDGATLSGLGLRETLRYSGNAEVAFYLELGPGIETLSVSEPAPNQIQILGNTATVVTGCAAPSCAF